MLCSVPHQAVRPGSPSPYPGKVIATVIGAPLILIPTKSLKLHT